MSEPPHDLDGARVLKYAVITADVEPTGTTRHTVRGVEFTSAAALAIARHPEEDGTYLLYLDHDGTVVTDTWHASPDDALQQAAFEYEGLIWADVTGG